MSKLYTATGIRVGSADDMATHQSVYTTSAIARGGWYFDHESKYFRYITKKHHIDVAGKALAGFHNARLKVFAPSLGYIRTAENAGVLLRLTDSLFAGNSIPELDGSALKRFKEVMTASLLENLIDVIASLGNQSIVVIAIYNHARDLGINFQQLLDWSKTLKYQRNIKNSCSQAEYEISPNDLVNEVHGMRKQLSELTNKIHTLESDKVEMKNKMQEMLNLMHQFILQNETPLSNMQNRRVENTYMSGISAQASNKRRRVEVEGVLGSHGEQSE